MEAMIQQIQQFNPNVLKAIGLVFAGIMLLLFMMTLFDTHTVSTTVPVTVPQVEVLQWASDTSWTRGWK